MNKKILIVDNFDSFTFNVVHSMRQISNASITVKRNNVVDQNNLDECTHIIFSPGPGLPEEAGQMPQILREYYSKKKILGICLGHQAIAECFGGKLKKLEKLHHGVSSTIQIQPDSFPLFKNLPAQIEVGRYHSWVIDPSCVPSELIVEAVDKDNSIMAVKHKKFPVFGVQFHPESVLTPNGLTILKNFIEL